MLLFWYFAIATVGLVCLVLASKLDEIYVSAWFTESSAMSWSLEMPCDGVAANSYRRHARRRRQLEVLLSALLLLVMASGCATAIIAGYISLWLAIPTVIAGAFGAPILAPKPVGRSYGRDHRHFMWRILCWSAIAGLASPVAVAFLV